MNSHNFRKELINDKKMLDALHRTTKYIVLCHTNYEVITKQIVGHNHVLGRTFGRSYKSN